MSTKLAKYDAARKALAEAHRIDEVKDIRDQAIAMQEYARQAKDIELIGYATEIRLRAEREWGLRYKPEVKARPTGANQHKKELQSRPKTEAQPTLKDMGVTKTQSSKWQGLAKLAPEKFEEKVQKAKTKAEDSTTSAPRHAKSEFTGENEWYTPDEYIELARTVLGVIDLDPATSAFAQKKIKAKNHYTAKDDGLAQKWKGRVWLNPPYAQPLISQFVAKMVSEFADRSVVAAIMLTHNYTDSAWFQSAAHAASAICFTRGRVKFYAADGAIAAPTQGQAFFYFGSDVAAFAQSFRSVGFVVKVHHG